MALWVSRACGQSANPPSATNSVRIVQIVNTVEVLSAGATNWVSTQTNQVLYPGDHLRTGPESKVALLWSDRSVAAFGPSTELEILPPHAANAEAGLDIAHGILWFFHRDQPGRIRVLTRGAVAGIEGTEFVIESGPADNPDGSRVSVIDGVVQLASNQGSLTLTNGEQAVVSPGRPPTRTAGFIANNLLQWCFYYPAVVELGDLPLGADEQLALADSLAAYRAGDLPHALANYPAGRVPGSDAERVYFAAVSLGVGNVHGAESALDSLADRSSSSRPQRLARALRLLISAVKREKVENPPAPELASEFLSRSYYEQSRALPDVSLEVALSYAHRAVVAAPNSGYGWERVAELEFSFGHDDAALAALAKATALTPRNAQAVVLKGFVFAGRNQSAESLAAFNEAIALDPALGNAWLGRGLSKIRRGDARGGSEDLLVAAALEPRRAELRSYLAKGYANSGDTARARKELKLAMGLDPHDPTAWLYSALLNQSDNRINEGIRDLEHSKDLNDNRSVYRSQLMLDEDQAVRSANLAALYQDAGMSQVAQWEAGRAVSYDYANYSAHLFLANSYDILRDPNQVNLRYETAAVTEYTLADLLAPVAAGPMTAVTSQQQYSPLFERNRIGVVSSTEYLSRGAWTEWGAQYGILGDFSYDIEAGYQSDPGQRPNEDLEQRQISGEFKQQITPKDTVLVQITQYQGNGGDTADYYDPSMANQTFRFDESQTPDVFLGYHHEWGPGVHTLVLAGRQQDTYILTNQDYISTLVSSYGNTTIDAVFPLPFYVGAETDTEIYSGELQQIWEQPAHTTIVGARYQWGSFQLKNLETPTFSDSGGYEGGIFYSPYTQDFSADFHRFSVYGYQSWQVADPLLLVAGLSFDSIRMPKNIYSLPYPSGERNVEQFSPKAGFVWTPTRDTTARFAFTRSLGGASLDQSTRLEPTEVAGINQAFRSLVPESVAGANSGAHFETFGLSLEQRFDTGTYLGLAGNLMYSDIYRLDGAFQYFWTNGLPITSQLKDNLNYRERSLIVTADQLVGRQWAVGADYNLTEASLTENFVDIPPTASDVYGFNPRPHQEAVLHELMLHANWNSPCGLFATVEGNWYLQSNQYYVPDEPGDDFWQFNVLAGYRFARRKAEAELGLLNITDRNYQLNPLTYYNELPRQRTLVARFQFNF